MRIYVTQEDIANGSRFSPDLCPVALALTRAGLYHFGVYGVFFLLELDLCTVTLLRLPTEVSDWIANYDAGRPAEPVTFDIELPEHSPKIDLSEALVPR
jgi:hypothetical protein